MLRQRVHILRAAMMAGDAAALGAAFVAAYFLAGPCLEAWLGLDPVLPLERYLWVLAAGVPLGWLLFASFGGYDLARFGGWMAGAGRLTPAMLLHGVMLAALVFFAKEHLFARRVIGVLIVFSWVAVVAARAAVLRAAAAVTGREGGLRRALVVGAGPAGRRFLEWARGFGWGLEVAGVLAPDGAGFDAPWLGRPSDIGRVLDEHVVDDVILAEPPATTEEMREIVRKCEEVGCVVHIPPDFFEAALSRPYVETFGGVSFLTFSATPYAPALLAVKRAVDVVGSLALLVVLSPLLALIYVAVRATSPGRGVFAQRRIGLNGRVFVMYKFRSMVRDAEAMLPALRPLNEMTGPAFKIACDPRVTWVGRRLRRFSLDELPQFWNVLRGDMSLVGPRPPLADEVIEYERWQRRRLSMRPGMTGLWQIRGRHRVGFDEWMRCDLEYIDRWSLWLDIRILVKTLLVVLRGEGV